ncbi:uncharacterized mitochondrial protein-like protein [Tanacetum coccineum]
MKRRPLEQNGFWILASFGPGKIDQTLFIKKQKGDILLVQVYVDDIIFGSTNKELCTGFEKLMKDKFQMSSMGELTFFLGLQVQQKEDGIFISQDKYVAEILKKFNYSDVKSASTPVDLEKPLVKDGDADDVDVHLYRSMIGSLMYLTASRPDIMFAVCACARFQVTPKTSHLLAVKRIFRYLKGKPTLGLWYSRDSPFELVAYTDSDYAGATLDRKSTTGGFAVGQVKHVEYKMLNASPFEKDNGLGSTMFKLLFIGQGKLLLAKANVNVVQLGHGHYKKIQNQKLQLFDGFMYQIPNNVLDLTQAKDAQLRRIAAFVEWIQWLKGGKYQEPTGGGIEDHIDADVDVSLVDETQERQDDDLIFDTRVLDILHLLDPSGTDIVSTIPTISTINIVHIVSYLGDHLRKNVLQLLRDDSSNVGVLLDARTASKGWSHFYIR